MDVTIRDTGGLWDCDSSLYDSFELRSFRRQLDSAINSRCLSLPRLSDSCVHPMAPAPKKQSRVLRSVHKLIRAVFRLKPSASAKKHVAAAELQIYGGYLSSDGLTTIPEGCEKGLESSPEFDPRAVTKAFSERYTSSTTGASSDTMSGGEFE